MLGLKRLTGCSYFHFWQFPSNIKDLVEVITHACSNSITWWRQIKAVCDIACTEIQLFYMNSICCCLCCSLNWHVFVRRRKPSECSFFSHATPCVSQVRHLPVFVNQPSVNSTSTPIFYQISSPWHFGRS